MNRERRTVLMEITSEEMDIIIKKRTERRKKLLAKRRRKRNLHILKRYILQKLYPLHFRIAGFALFAGSIAGYRYAVGNDDGEMAFSYVLLLLLGAFITVSKQTREMVS